MALFKKKTDLPAQAGEKKETQKAAASRPEVSRRREISAGSSKKHAGAILRAPRITEKATVVAERGVYVFDVAKHAGKREIAEAVHALFKVFPVKVRVAQVPGKVRISKLNNRKGHSASGKKAYVYLKKGDAIDIS